MIMELFAAVTVKIGVYITTTQVIQGSGMYKIITKLLHYGVMPSTGLMLNWTPSHTTTLRNLCVYVKL